METELLTIGSELTSGATVNTNAAELAQRLASLGIRVQRCVSVGDERADVIEALREALRRCELLITTGGLGPTFDDCTMEAIAEATRRPLVYHPPVAAAIRRFYTAHRRRLKQAALRQAWLPQGGGALPNPLGTAPGLWLSLRSHTDRGSRLQAPGNTLHLEVPNILIALPGVPAEMRAILVGSVLPRLRRLAPHRAVETLTLRTAGIVELEIEAMLKQLRIPEGVEIGLYPHLRMVDVRLTASAASRAAARRALRLVEQPLRRALDRHLYGTNEQTLEAVIGTLLLQRRRTLGVAESCTGGLVCDRLTNVPGSSRYLRGGVVAYHNDLKRHPLGVPNETLARDGAVSAQVARGMAQGIRQVAGADLGLALTGIAGPTGATATKPVGLVYLALADGTRTRTMRCRFLGDRVSIKLQAAQTALDWLRRVLLQDPVRSGRKTRPGWYTAALWA
jgi:nicotinamide-nucleotide amidase